MKDIAIYGAGGFGREVACLINKINQISGPSWNLIGFFDDGIPSGSQVSHFGKILGGINEVNNWPRPLCMVLCFGIPNIIKKVRLNIKNSNISFPNLIHPNFIVSDYETFEIGCGNIIMGGCAVTTNVNLENFNILDGDVVLGHDSHIGNYNVFMPGSRISGEVLIKDCNLFGAVSFIKQQLKIGNNVTLAPLSALLTKPKDGFTYIGNPAKIFKF